MRIKKPPWSAAVFCGLAAAAGEVVAFAVFQNELVRAEVDDVRGDGLLRFVIDVARDVFRRQTHLRLGFVGQDEARFDGFQQDFVACRQLPSEA